VSRGSVPVPDSTARRFSHPSFVTLQRAYRHGYDTEYLGWFFNREELIEAAAEAKLAPRARVPRRTPPRVHAAPEQAEARGYLFRSGEA
jgi:hypothetical protein